MAYSPYSWRPQLLEARLAGRCRRKGWAAAGPHRPAYSGRRHNVSPRAQLNTFNQAAQSIDIQCKVNKTVCMSYAPKTVVRLCRTASIYGGWHEAKICIQFCYLGHILQNSECDDDDIASQGNTKPLRSY